MHQGQPGGVLGALVAGVALAWGARQSRFWSWPPAKAPVPVSYMPCAARALPPQWRASRFGKIS